MDLQEKLTENELYYDTLNFIKFLKPDVEYCSRDVKMLEDIKTLSFGCPSLKKFLDRDRELVCQFINEIVDRMLQKEVLPTQIDVGPYLYELMGGDIFYSIAGPIYIERKTFGPTDLRFSYKTVGAALLEQ